jgi:hypothetical protein
MAPELRRYDTNLFTHLRATTEKFHLTIRCSEQGVVLAHANVFRCVESVYRVDAQ